MPTITEKLIKSITPTKKRKIFWDDKLICFGVRQNLRKYTFVLNYKFNEKQKTFKIGDYPDISVSQAREMALQLKNEIARGFDPLENKKRISEIPILKEFVEEFLKAKQNVLRAKSIQFYKESCLRGHIIPKLGHYKMNLILKRDIERFHLSFEDSKTLANRCLALLRSMFNMAISWEIIEKNPTDGIKKFPEQARQRYLSDDEIRKLMDVLKQENSLNKSAIQLMLLTGSRKSEVLSAKWKDFDFENNVWIKPAESTKQKKPSYVPLNSEALSIVLKMKKEIVVNEKLDTIKDKKFPISSQDYLFYLPKTGTYVRDIKKFWAKICKKAGIKQARIHDLRHTFASVLVNSGVSLEVIGKLIGHSSIKTTQRYSHLANNTLKEASEVFSKRLTI